jgi:hypothetical protein
VSFGLTRRRGLGLVLTALVGAGVAYGAAISGAALDHAQEATGWLLFAVCLFLLIFNLRKRMSAFPFVRAHFWLQAHIYIGLLAGIVFFAHTDWRFPTGLLDWALWVVFAAIFISGVLGIVLTRIVPARLNSRGERVIFERIPAFRAQLARQVEELVLRSVKEAASGTIAELYAKQLLQFLNGPRNFWGHVFSTTAYRRNLQREFDAVRRYLGPEANQLLGEIEELVLAKDDLDFQYAWALLIKGWLLFHLPLSCAMIPLLAVHILVNYAFSLGAL